MEDRNLNYDELQKTKSTLTKQIQAYRNELDNRKNMTVAQAHLLMKVIGAAENELRMYDEEIQNYNDPEERNLRL